MIKKKGEFCYKMKNLYLFFQIYIVPLKIFPPTAMHLFQRFFQSSKHAEKSFVGIAFNARTVSRSISSIHSKRFPRSGLLSFGNSQKSHGAKSGEYGGCGATWVEFLAKTHEESGQCATVHYLGAKSKSCCPIIPVSFCE